MAANGEFVPVETPGLGVNRGLDPWLDFLPDFSGIDLSVVNFAEVRMHLGMDEQDELHVLSELDMTLRHNYAPEVDEETARNVQAQLEDGVITSFHIATNSRSPDLMVFGSQISPDTRVFAPVRIRGSESPVAYKQHEGYYERIMGELGITDEVVVAVGHKYRRDIYGGNRANIYTMRVMPLPGPDMWFDRIWFRDWDDFASVLGQRALAELKQAEAADDV